MPENVILLDGDVLRYRFAFRNQNDYDFGDTGQGQELDPDQALEDVDNFILDCQKTCKADRVVVCLTDDEWNWRNAIYGPYKQNRDHGARPVLHGEISRHMQIEYETFERPGLEADDVMGILSTSPHIIPGTKIIVSMDKDMETIPGLFFNPNEHKKPVRISQELADRNHMMQTLTGDPVDNYPGCPRVGKKTAEAILDWPHLIEPVLKVLTRGKNKGQSKRVGWHKEEADSVWNAVVSYFENFAGLTEQDALIQAQVARICRREDYDFEKREVIPWTPAS